MSDLRAFPDAADGCSVGASHRRRQGRQTVSGRFGDWIPNISNFAAAHPPPGSCRHARLAEATPESSRQDLTRKDIRTTSGATANVCGTANIGVRRRRHGDADRRNREGQHDPQRNANQATTDTEQHVLNDQQTGTPGRPGCPVPSSSRIHRSAQKRSCQRYSRH